MNAPTEPPDNQDTTDESGGRWALFRYAIYCRQCGQLRDRVSETSQTRRNPSQYARSHHRSSGHDVIVLNLHATLYSGSRGMVSPRLWARHVVGYVRLIPGIYQRARLEKIQ